MGGLSASGAVREDDLGISKGASAERLPIRALATTLVVIQVN